jgi:hypothetical protein
MLGKTARSRDTARIPDALQRDQPVATIALVGRHTTADPEENPANDRISASSGLGSGQSGLDGVSRDIQIDQMPLRLLGQDANAIGQCFSTVRAQVQSLLMICSVRESANLEIKTNVVSSQLNFGLVDLLNYDLASLHERHGHLSRSYS